MLSQRQRVVVIALAALAAIWIAALTGYWIVSYNRVTPDKVRAYVESIDFSKLTPAERQAAIRKLADMLNHLSLQERQGLRMDRTSYRWFEQMTENEKGEFLDATMPTGFKQMLSSFEQLPEERRQRAINEAVKRLRNVRENLAANGAELPPATNNPVLSEELQQKVATIGLKTFYSQSSAQTKAEMAPLLEEIQRMMESGAFMRGGRRR